VIPHSFAEYSLRRFFAYIAVVFALVFMHAEAHSLHIPGWKHISRPVLVGYFPQWGLYSDKPYTVKMLVQNGSAKILDQINYAQGFVTNGRCSVADPNADLNTTYTRENSVNGRSDNPSSPFRGYFHQMQELKHRYPHLKILISLEGRASSFADDAKPEHRQAFVASCIDTFIRGNFAPGIHEPALFDGFDIDWEYPEEADAANFRALLEEFRRQMQAVRPGLRLSIAVGHAPQMEAGTDFATLAPLVDQIGVMNYDYTGPWSHTTGFLAPLFAERSGSIERSMTAYLAAGVPAQKLLMGVPFYGYSWTAVVQTNDGLFQNGQSVRGDQPYHYIRTLSASFQQYRDPRSHAPWLFDGTTFWTYEDPTSVRYKASYAVHEHIGGVMVWELSEDTNEAELLDTIYRSLHHPLGEDALKAPATAVANNVNEHGSSGSGSASAVGAAN
jgi:chitinase